MLSKNTFLKKSVKITVFLPLNRNNMGGKSRVNYSFILCLPNSLTNSNKTYKKDNYTSS